MAHWSKITPATVEEKLVMSWVFAGEEISPRFLAGAVIILLGLIINQQSFSGTREEETEPAINQSQAALSEKIL